MHRSSWIGRVWIALCAAGIAWFSLARTLLRGDLSLPSSLQGWILGTLRLSPGDLLTTFPGLLLPLTLTALFAVLLPLRRRWCLVEWDSRLGLHRFWLHTTWLLLLGLELALNRNRYVSNWIWTTLPLALFWLWARTQRADTLEPVGRFAWLTAGAVSVILAPGPLAGFGVATWFVAVLLLLIVGSARLLPATLFVGFAGAILAAQIATRSPVQAALILALLLSPSALRAGSRIWIALCACGILWFCLARSLFYSTSIPVELGDPIGSTLQFSTRLMLTTFTALLIPLGWGAFFLLSLLFRRRWCLAERASRFGLHPFWLHLFWFFLFGCEFAFDINGYVGRWTWATLPLALLWLWARTQPAEALERVARFAWLAAGVVAVILASGPLDRLGTTTWFVAILLLVIDGGPRLLPATLLLACAVAIPAAQVASTHVVFSVVFLGLLVSPRVVGIGSRLLRRIGLTRGAPAVAVLAMFVGILVLIGWAGRALRPSGAVLLGEGLAYSFCEMPETGRIYAGIPNCNTTSESCKGGVIAEYDLEGATPPRRLEIFAESDSWGRIEQLACIDGEIQVGICCTNSGVADDEATLTLSPTAPSRHRLHPPETTARRIVADPRHRAIYYVGDHVRRLDRDSGLVSSELEEDLIAASDVREATSKRMFLAESASLSEELDRIYIAEFNIGSNVYEIDLATQKIVATLRPASGGVLAVAVDEGLGRIWITSMYGLEIYDAGTHERLMRRRTGTFPRMPVIDPDHDLVYVPTTIAGRIEIRDRHTGRKLGQIEIGIETRFAHLSLNGRWLLATANGRHYYWRTQDLVDRFGP